MRGRERGRDGKRERECTAEMKCTATAGEWGGRLSAVV